METRFPDWPLICYHGLGFTWKRDWTQIHPSFCQYLSMLCSQGLNEIAYFFIRMVYNAILKQIKFLLGCNPDIKRE